jgi:hypothetical protein
LLSALRDERDPSDLAFQVHDLEPGKRSKHPENSQSAIDAMAFVGSSVSEAM